MIPVSAHLSAAEVAALRAADIAGRTYTYKQGPANVMSTLTHPKRIWYGTGALDHELLPAGFSFDGASVPWVARRSFPPDRGEHWAPAILHDYYYRHHRQADGRFISRADADRRFLAAMRLYGTPPWRARMMYRAVRIGGARAWNPVPQANTNPEEKTP